MNLDWWKTDLPVLLEQVAPVKKLEDCLWIKTRTIYFALLKLPTKIKAYQPFSSLN